MRTAFTWDPSVDAAYINFKRVIEPGSAIRQIIIDPGEAYEYEVTLDLDTEGHLLGMEILGAMDALGKKTLWRMLRLRDKVRPSVFRRIKANPAPS